MAIGTGEISVIDLSYEEGPAWITSAFWSMRITNAIRPYEAAGQPRALRPAFEGAIHQCGRRAVGPVEDATPCRPVPGV